MPAPVRPTGVLSGLVDFYVANYGSLTGLLSAWKVQPIAVSAKTRWADLPDVPMLDELGIKDAESDTFQALFAPAGTPQPIIKRLAKETARILGEPEMQAKFAKLGLPSSPRRRRHFAPASHAKCRRTEM